MSTLGEHLREAMAALSGTFRNPALRRLQLASAGSTFGSMSCWVAISVYAFGHGGARGVAVIAIVGLIPTALSAPFAASLADRFQRRRVMLVADIARAVFMGAIGATIALGGPVWTVYVILAASSIIGASFSPARQALLPTLARTPAELTAANVAMSTIDSAGSFLGPAVGGFLVAATSIQLVFALNGVSFLWSAALVFGIRETERSAESGPQRGRVWEEATAGFRTIIGNRDVRVLVWLFIAQTLVAGALTVLVVVTAFDLLHGGPKQVGLLDASAGVGGLIGSFAALALSARGRLAADFALGLVLFGSLALIGAAPDVAPAVIALGVFGIGNSLVDIAAFTLLQRAVPNEVLGRVFGALEGILLGAITIGTIAAPGLIDLFGARTSIIAVGAVLPVLTLLSWPRLRRIDITAAAPGTVDLLRGVEIFAALPLATLERLARSLTEVCASAGTTVIRKGDAGDRFYVVEDGTVEIEGSTFGPGSSFGEIALLRDVPRTATVTAQTDVILQALERNEFLAAVTASEPSRAAAEAVISHRLGEMGGG